MIRLAWRQFRTEAGIALGALALVAIVLGATGPHLVYVYDTDPSQLANTFRSLQGAMVALLLVVPALPGIFCGAPHCSMGRATQSPSRAEGTHELYRAVPSRHASPTLRQGSTK